jgi:hypothetical protein
MVLSADHQREGAVLMQITTIGLDIAKNVFQVHGIDGEGQAMMVSVDRVLIKLPR